MTFSTIILIMKKKKQQPLCSSKTTYTEETTGDQSNIYNVKSTASRGCKDVDFVGNQNILLSKIFSTPESGVEIQIRVRESITLSNV